MHQSTGLLVLDDRPGRGQALASELTARRPGLVVRVGGRDLLAAEAPVESLVLVEEPPKEGAPDLESALRRWGGTRLVVVAEQPDLAAAVRWVRAGVWDYRVRPLALDDVLAQVDALAGPSADQPEPAEIIGASDSVAQIKHMIRLVKDVGTTVLITGETGTGKELVARAIHNAGRRQGQPILCINCGAIPEDLLEAELFGHARGAFTGAAGPRRGYFELADGGTLFLDEIGNMGPRIQQKLLRVLEDRSITPLGTSRPRAVDVRIVAATNADLSRLVGEGAFREDLYYRLNVFPIHVPPLRERREDIPALAQHFIARMAEREGLPVKRPDDGCLDALRAYDWPGNIRELRNAMEYAMIVSADSAWIGVRHFRTPLVGRGIEPAVPIRPPAAPDLDLEPVTPDLPMPEPGDGIDFTAIVHEVERKLLLEGLRQAGGNKQKAARLLKMKRTTLVEKLKRLQPGEAEDPAEENAP